MYRRPSPADRHGILFETSEGDRLRVETTEATFEGRVGRIVVREPKNGPGVRRVHLGRRIGLPHVLVCQFTADGFGPIRAFRARRVVTGDGNWRGVGTVVGIERVEPETG